MKNETKYTIVLLLLLSSAAAMPASIPVWQIEGMPQFGDILYNGYSAYVVERVNSDTVYSYNLDFGEFPQLRCGGSPVPMVEESQMTKCMSAYSIVGRAPDGIIEILKSNHNEQEKQVLIWADEGVDSLSLQTKCKELGLGIDWSSLEKEVKYYQSKRSSLNLKEAEQTPWITLEVTPYGYSSVGFQVSSEGKSFFLLVERGRTLVNQNQQNQNIALAETKVAFVPADGSRQFDVRSYCINQHKGSPIAEDKTTVGEIVEEKLYKVIAAGDILGKAATGAAQQAVWHETDNASVTQDEASEIMRAAEQIDLGPDNPHVEDQPDIPQQELLLRIEGLLRELLARLAR